MTTTNPIDLDGLDSRILTRAIRSGVEAYRARKVFFDQASAGLAGAAEALRRAISENDPAAAEQASRVVRERQLILDAIGGEPELDPDTSASMRVAVSRVAGRWGEVAASRETVYYDEAQDKAKLALGKRFGPWQRAWAAWARSGEGAQRGIDLLIEGAAFDDEIDAFLARWPIPARPEDSLIRREDQPRVLNYIDLGNRSR